MNIKNDNKSKKNETDNQTFEQFADGFLKELLNRVNEAKKILST